MVYDEYIFDVTECGVFTELCFVPFCKLICFNGCNYGDSFVVQTHLLRDTRGP